MWDVSDFEELESLHLGAAEDYRRKQSNGELARTLFVGTHNLHDFRLEIERTAGDFTDKRHEMQLLYLRRGPPALFAMYWLTKHHLYSATYSRIRFSWELYWVVRELNRDKDKTEKKWRKLEAGIKRGDFGPNETLPTTEYFSGKRRQLRGELFSEDESYGQVYDRISNFGSHPNSMRSSEFDGKWSEELERDVLQFGLVFLFAITAQYVRTFEETPIANAVRSELDGIFVQVLLAHGYLPIFLEEDMEFGSHLS